MTLKQFKVLQLIMVIILGATVGASVGYHNYIIPIIAIIVAISLMFFFRGKVKEIMADERDYEIGGKAARLAITVFSWIMIIVMFAFLAFQNQEPDFAIIASAIAYTVCLLMVLYSIFFRYYNKVAFLEKKFVYILAGVLLILLLTIAGLRLLSGEDNWMCQDGQWVKHGVPSAPMPSVECKK